MEFWRYFKSKVKNATFLGVVVIIENSGGMPSFSCCSGRALLCKHGQPGMADRFQLRCDQKWTRPGSHDWTVMLVTTGTESRHFR